MSVGSECYGRLDIMYIISSQNNINIVTNTGLPSQAGC